MTLITVASTKLLI